MISEDLTSSYPEICHGVSSVGYGEGFQKRFCDIAKQGFAVEIIYCIELTSMLMEQRRYNSLGKCFCHMTLKGVLLLESKKNCAIMLYLIVL